MTTIIIPSHNERENLTRLLPQLVDFRNAFDIEIIVALSSANSDGSELLVAEHDVRSVSSGKKGRAVQMNTAAHQAKGDILAFLHADVQPPHSFVQDIAETIDAGYDAGFFSYRFDKKSFFLQLNAAFTAKDSIFTGGGDQCLFIKKEIFKALGGFDEDQVLMEDFEFFRRMKKNNLRYKIIRNDLVVSARKYRNNSYLRINLANFLLVVLFKCGYPAKKLKCLHDRLINMPYRNK